jgi:hypothetical protein
MTGEIILYQNSEGNIKLDVRLEEETVWLNQMTVPDTSDPLFRESSDPWIPEMV